VPTAPVAFLLQQDARYGTCPAWYNGTTFAVFVPGDNLYQEWDAMKQTLLFLFLLGLLAGCRQVEDQSTPAIRIEAPGARIVVDGEKGVVDIEADGTRVYADKSGQVHIIAPGVNIEAKAE
jgi:hypothetical protein